MYSGFYHQPLPPMTSDRAGIANAALPGSTNQNYPPSKHSNCITLNTKPFHFYGDESMISLNHSALLKIHVLYLEVSGQSEASDTLKFSIHYHNLANLENFAITNVTLSKVSELLGSCWEPQPYGLKSLKSPLILALQICHKIKHMVIDHQELLLILVSCGKSPNSRNRVRSS